MGREWAFFDNPFEEGLNLDIETCVRVLAGNNAVDSRVGESSTVIDGRESVFGSILWVFYEAGEGASGADGVLAGNDGERFRVSPAVNSFGNDGGYEFEDVGSNGTGNLEVCSELR